MKEKGDNKTTVIKEGYYSLQALSKDKETNKNLVFNTLIHSVMKKHYLPYLVQKYLDGVILT